MTHEFRNRRTTSFAIFTLMVVALCIGLGAWQLQRRAEKHALMAALDERLAAAPVPLPPPSQWSGLTPDRDEFRRVSFTATYQPEFSAMVYSSGSSIRADISGPGTWAFLPARLPSGEIVAINAGFIANTMQDPNLQQRAVARLVSEKPVMLTGYVRFAVAAGLFTPDADYAKRLWFTRDHLAMAQALGWSKDGRLVAPFYIDLEQPVPPNGIPKPGPLDPHLTDNHLQYAITWFGLAGAALIAFGFWARGRQVKAQ